MNQASRISRRRGPRPTIRDLERFEGIDRVVLEALREAYPGPVSRSHLLKITNNAAVNSSTSRIRQRLRRGNQPYRLPPAEPGGGGEWFYRLCHRAELEEETE